jgi:hypothetical protein
MLTVAIPTIGRPTLARCVFSFIEQLEPGDTVLLIADPKGDTEYVRWMHQVATNKLGVNWRFVIRGGEGGWGQPQRNYAYKIAPLGSHVWCLSDDDVATSNALNLLRAACHDRWSIFRAGRANGAPWVWQDQAVRIGNLDADCILAPAGVDARWGLGYEGDYEFARACQSELGEPVWRSETIAVTKPNGEYLDTHYAWLTGDAINAR